MAWTPRTSNFDASSRQFHHVPWSNGISIPYAGMYSLRQTSVHIGQTCWIDDIGLHTRAFKRLAAPQQPSGHTFQAMQYVGQAPGEGPKVHE